MAQLPLAAILWRPVNKATVDALSGISVGQYDIRLTSLPSLREFFGNLPKNNLTNKGGFDFDVEIEPFAGSPPVPRQVLKVRFMGEQSQRKDWNIPSQRPDTAYPLWRQNRGLPPNLNGQVPQPPHYLILARDVYGRFHARYLNEAGVAALPEGLRADFANGKVGIHLFHEFNDIVMPNTPSASVALYQQLRAHFNVMLYGPPGTGKTHLMQDVVRLFSESLVLDTAEEKTPLRAADRNVRIGWVTFHQSYSYEQFVVGLQSDLSSDKLLSLVPRPGLLLELTEWARRPGHEALLIIDEINRGNVSRIFGEFITLMEPDKRLDAQGQATPSTVALRLPYGESGRLQVPLEEGAAPAVVPHPFTMPRGVYTLASMNSVDKSVAPLDAALRRRFFLFHLAPDSAVIASHLGLSGYSSRAVLPTAVDAAGIKALAVRLLEVVNRSISFYLGPEFRLGHWYLEPLSAVVDWEDAKTALCDLWERKLLPQLEELFHGRIDQLQEMLRLPRSSEGGDRSSPLFLEDPPEEVAELGGVAVLGYRISSADETIAFLRRIVTQASTRSEESRDQEDEQAADDAGAVEEDDSVPASSPVLDEA